MAKSEVQVLGLNAVLKRIDEKYRHIEDATRRSIAADVNRLKKRINMGLGGSASKSRFGMYKRGSASGAGTGTEIFASGTVSNIINVKTGRMRSALSSEMGTEKWNGFFSGPSGGVGWNSGYRGSSKAAAHRLDWPAKRLVAGRIRSKKKGQAGTLPPSRMPPSIYVGQVLLGTDAIIGRNVLRMALVDNIRKKKTIKRLKNTLKKVVARGAK